MDPVCVYGATGYTGRLVAGELARRGAPMVLAGRSADGLRRAERHARAAGGDVVRTVAVDLERAGEAIAGCPVVINAAGPFLFTGAPVLQAAIDAGAHYVDTTGEQPWMAEVFDRFDAPLREAGVAAVPAMGFDYVPGDLLCHLVAQPLGELEELTVAYDVAGFGMTRGTMRSALEMLKGGDLTYRGGTWRPAGLGPLRASAHFPAPVGRRRCAKYPCGEVVTVPRHVQVRDLRHLLSTRSVGAVGPLEDLLPVLMPAVSAALRVGPLRAALHAAIGRLPEGPPEQARRAASWTIVAQGRTADGRHSGGMVRGPDVYGLTAVMTVHGALQLRDGTAKRSAGALSPAMAYDALAFLRHLKPFGVDWDLTDAHEGQVRVPTGR
jgi:short subunit dehydrogenase-like uncharacterized protein